MRRKTRVDHISPGPRRSTFEVHMKADPQSSSAGPRVLKGRGVLYTPRASRIGLCRYTLKWSAQVYDLEVGLLRGLQEQYGAILPERVVRPGSWAQSEFVLELEDGERLRLVVDDEAKGDDSGWLAVKRTG